MPPFMSLARYDTCNESQFSYFCIKLLGAGAFVRRQKSEESAGSRLIAAKMMYANTSRAPSHAAKRIFALPRLSAMLPSTI
jgi:hypothetical protein